MKRFTLNITSALLIPLSIIQFGAGLLLFPQSARAAVAIVQQTSLFEVSGAGLTTSGSFGATPAAGNTIVVLISYTRPGGTDFSGVTDNKGNTYTAAAVASDATDENVTMIYYAENITSSGTFTITLNFNLSSENDVTWTAVELSGASGGLDVVRTNTSTTGDASVTATRQTSANDQIVFAMATLFSTDAAANLTTPSGYTQLALDDDANTATDPAHQSSYKTLTSRETPSASWSHDNTSQTSWTAALASFAGACNPAVEMCTVSFTTAGYGSWTAPSGATSAVVACWGGGGGGGDGTNAGAGGGGGGAYAASTVSVTPGTQYTLFIGNGGSAGTAGGSGGNGSDSTFATTTVVADGGLGGAGANAADSSGGAGGSVANSTGDVENDGGTGGGGTNTGDTGGGGGGAGGPNGDGQNGSAGNGTIGGAGGAGDNGSGGSGGDGGDIFDGESGKADANGGGGGGGGDNATSGGIGGAPGGGGGGGEGGGAAGATGKCTVTYTTASTSGPLPRHIRLFEGFRVKLIEGKMRVMQQ